MAKIVVGVDGSKESADAVRWALGEASRTGDPVHLVAAYEYPSAWLGMGEALGSAVAPTIGDDDLKQYALSGITDALDGIEIPDGVSLTSEAIAGHPSDVLVALSHDASLVVVGSRGHGDIGSALIGSVGMHVIHHSECPVVVLPHPRRSRRSK